VLVLNTHLPNGRPALALLATRAYRVTGTALSPEREERPLRQEAVTAPSSNPGALDYLVHESDLFAAARSLCDVLVHGSARPSRGPTKTLDTGVRIGASKKVVRVWGNRTISLDGQGRLRFSEPDAFASMPLTWDNAYGGRDEVAEARLFPPKKPRFGKPAEADGPRLVGYPRNAAGRGFHVDLERERLEGARLPNLEDPEDPVTPDRLLARGPLDWLDRPMAACYSPIDILAFPRAAFVLAPAFDPPARPVREVALGALQQEDLAGRDLRRPKLDLRAAQSAPAGLSVAITGRVRVSLWNLWPGRETLEVELPPEVPQLVLEPPGCPPRELKPELKTVIFDLDEERVDLVWSGAMPVAAPFPEEMCASMRRAVRWGQK
jgi:hypothetical protein